MKVEIIPYDGLIIVYVPGTENVQRYFGPTSVIAFFGGRHDKLFVISPDEIRVAWKYKIKSRVVPRLPFQIQNEILDIKEQVMPMIENEDFVYWSGLRSAYGSILGTIQCHNLYSGIKILEKYFEVDNMLNSFTGYYNYSNEYYLIAHSKLNTVKSEKRIETNEKKSEELIEVSKKKEKIDLLPYQIERLINQLSDRSYKVRLSAVSKLGQISGQQMIEPLIKCFSDKNQKVRMASIQVLTQMNDKNLIETLLPYLSSKNWRIREAAELTLNNYYSECGNYEKNYCRSQEE